MASKQVSRRGFNLALIGSIISGVSGLEQLASAHIPKRDTFAPIYKTQFNQLNTIEKFEMSKKKIVEEFLQIYRQGIDELPAAILLYNNKTSNKNPHFLLENYAILTESMQSIDDKIAVSLRNDSVAALLAVKEGTSEEIIMPYISTHQNLLRSSSRKIRIQLENGKSFGKEFTYLARTKNEFNEVMHPAQKRYLEGLKKEGKLKGRYKVFKQDNLYVVDQLGIALLLSEENTEKREKMIKGYDRQNRMNVAPYDPFVRAVLQKTAAYSETTVIEARGTYINFLEFVMNDQKMQGRDLREPKPKTIALLNDLCIQKDLNRDQLWRTYNTIHQTLQASGIKNDFAAAWLTKAVYEKKQDSF